MPRKLKGRSRQKKKKADLTTKVKRSYVRQKPTSLMVNPEWNKLNKRLVMPMKYRTKVNLIYSARESSGATANNNFVVNLNGIITPLNTSINAPGVRIDGTASTVTTSSPLGVLDLLGNTANAGLYQEYCVLNAKYKITYFPLGLNDAQYVVIVPARNGTTFASINSMEEYPYASKAKFMVGYNSVTQNTISGRINCAKLLGYDNDESYANEAISRGTRTTNPAVGSGSNSNLINLYVYRSCANGTVLSSALPYKIELEYDVEFTRVSANFSE